MGYNVDSTGRVSPVVIDELELSPDNLIVEKSGTAQLDSLSIMDNDNSVDNLSFNQNSRRPYLDEPEFTDVIGTELAALVDAMNDSSTTQRDDIVNLTNFLRQFSNGRALKSQDRIEKQKQALEVTQRNVDMTKSQNDTMKKLNTAFMVISMVSMALPGIGGMLGKFFQVARTAMEGAAGVNRILAFAGTIVLSVPQIVQCIFGVQLSRALEEQARIEQETGTLGADIKELASFYDFFSKILQRDTGLTKETLENSFDVLSSIGSYYSAQKQMGQHLAQAV